MIAPRPRRRAAWPIGIVVLAALAVAIWQVVRRDPALSLRAPAGGSAALAPALPVAPLLPAAAADQASPKVVAQVAGVVRGADGQPLPGATVSLYRATTAWPEWQRERLERALVGADGAFRFVAPAVHGLLVGVEHPQHAEQLVEARAGGPPLDLRLAPGFALDGVVLTEAGAPLANARVAVEAVVGDDRRARVAVTTSAGAFRFTNLEAGPARLVARHPSWQPAVLPVVVVGEQPRVSLRVARPTLAPVRGIVLSVETRAPVPDAVIELLPANSRAGLADPLTARTGADGRFTITGIGRGVMRLVVRHPGFGAVARGVQVGVDDALLEVELPRRAAVTGALEVARGATLSPGVWLRLRDIGGQIGFATVGADGVFRFPGDWSPGLAELRAVDDDCVFTVTRRPAVNVRIDELAVAEVSLTVASPRAISARVVDERGVPIAGAMVVRRGRRSDEMRAVGDAAAQFDVGDVGRGLARIFTTARDAALATTDASGVVTVTMTEPWLPRLQFSAPGRATVAAIVAPDVATVAADVAADVAVDGARARETMVVLPPAARLQGQVLRAGKPFVGAVV
ncbi:MAG: carboxypeptidase regulatory-like domain-containing protein, partial [Planctomycetes bacterium]|nr:carboxypeptidase regulatory-like domain-containing protein [Planctomycetota bacterium]